MIHKHWTATSMVIAAPTAPLLLAGTMNSRLGPGLGRGGRRSRRCSRNAVRGNPPGAQLLQDRARTRPLPAHPPEGPCECDLNLRCPKFFTASEDGPRLRDRLPAGQQLIQDATERGRPREAERHTAISGRICTLLTEPGEPARTHAGEH